MESVARRRGGAEVARSAEFKVLSAEQGMGSMGGMGGMDRKDERGTAAGTGRPVLSSEC